MNQPYMNQMYPQYPYQQTSNPNGINWVQGIEGAKAFQLQPNGRTILMDSENDGIFYIKICDNIGMCNLRTFRYEEIHPNSTHVDLSEYVKKSELESIINSMLGGTASEQSLSGVKSTITQ